MAPELLSALSALVDRLTVLAAEDASLRDHLRHLAEAVLAATRTEPAPGPATHSSSAEASSPPAPLPVPLDGDRESPPSPSRSGPNEVALRGPTNRLVPPDPLGARPAPDPHSWPTTWGPDTTADLLTIEQRCRLKAEGARWAATRRRRMSEGADFRTEIEPKDQDIIGRAKALPNCFLWMCHPSGPSPSDPAAYQDVAGCFDALADALALVRTILDTADGAADAFAQALDLLAEAQSALRAVVASIDGPTDTDQQQAFNWLRRNASEHQVFIPRYMRTDDAADPTCWLDLSARIDAVDSQLQEFQKRGKQRKKLLGKIRHKVSLLGSDPDNVTENWRLLAATVDELVATGVPPSNTEVRELLLPVIDDVPDLPDLPRSFQLVLREIDRYLSLCPAPALTAVAPEPTSEVQAAARLLEGRSLVLIGGERRPAAHDALERQLGLHELIWIETREHQSIAGFEAYIARPDVAAVLLAIRWSSHSFGDVKDFCDRHGKPLVRLPAGYNPNQVAVQILAQCSARLTVDG